jgi:hypothetical protein
MFKFKNQDMVEHYQRMLDSFMEGSSYAIDGLDIPSQITDLAITRRNKWTPPPPCTSTASTAAIAGSVDAQTRRARDVARATNSNRIRLETAVRSTASAVRVAQDRTKVRYVNARYTASCPHDLAKVRSTHATSTPPLCRSFENSLGMDRRGRSRRGRRCVLPA